MLSAGVGHWEWPERPDKLVYEEFLDVIEPPKLSNNRNLNTIPALKGFWCFIPMLGPNYLFFFILLPNASSLDFFRDQAQCPI